MVVNKGNCKNEFLPFCCKASFACSVQLGSRALLPPSWTCQFNCELLSILGTEVRRRTEKNQLLLLYTAIVVVLLRKIQ